MVAVSPAAGEMEKPAPTTCATSWMVAPMNTPARVASSPSQLVSAGYSTIAAVDSVVTPMTTRVVRFSWPSRCGSTLAMASAAEAPQIAVAPPASRPRSRS